MKPFFRFPHTPHLIWLGQGVPRDDKVLSKPEVKALLSDEVVVEEKLDGANLGFSLDEDGHLLAQNRGQYLHDPLGGQFARLPGWMELHDEALRSVLTPELMLFGEWCAARHSLDYDALPDWYLLFDVYDRAEQRFWGTARRNALAESIGLITVPRILAGHTSVADLRQLVTDRPSLYRSGPLEGVVIRREAGDWADSRAKLVRPDFTQAIDTHWRNRAIEWNRVDWSRGG
ncbi:MAG: RNA ligase family protein [Lautropia sp.]|nr:RNA ligase family protein [Lautropia sp.]